MRRFFSRLILVPLALLFLFEAWLWDQLAPLVAALVEALPLKRIKAWISVVVSQLSPPLTLIVFAVPALLLFPLKLLGLWLFGHGQWLLGVGTIIFAKLVGVGVTAFLFELTRPTLLQMPWFRAFYETVLRLRRAASVLVDPVKRKIQRTIRLFAPKNAKRTFRLLRKLRRVRRLARYDRH